MDDFVAGGVAALAAITVMHPLDVVKSRMQFQGEQGQGQGQGQGSKGAYRGVLSSLISIAKKEGMPGLYRGIMPAYGLQVAVTSTRFGVYGISKRILADYDAGREEERGKWANFLMAGVSGACGGVLGTPFFALKTRAQVYSTDSSLAVGQQHKVEGLWSGLKAMYQRDGVLGFTRGMNAFVPRVVVYGAAQLGVYEVAKPLLQERVGLKEGLPLHFTSAFVAAIAAVITIQPFDFLSARLSNDPHGKLYSGMGDCAIKSVRAEGPTCFLKGCWANMCRMGPYTVLVLVFFEQSKNLIKS
mmetsp:Transcript_15341/g.27275  ORF Transcript_15341/g.27275 Transcript_15341/m.27275 type:complete len:300 (+) Transcript_15341:621-1520(+)|eukprot:CAMPEP_0184543812 /NCGR_PEP_ID=MMETSP0199_2-20130426/3186_1 /TAXON_ID=1112570 /ORGANISM="Thraustochytrium sp., Strain LLF1b" /LENGTH=299 /DNA_ID=CAMNT_0026937887 /DNA_START=575 /DNA_END=1474 /DNA_ORIENTATION=-